MSKETAREYLLRSIYNTDTVSETMASLPIAKHIAAATELEKVRPFTIDKIMEDLKTVNLIELLLILLIIYTYRLQLIKL